jgi:hypothetical protein
MVWTMNTHRFPQLFTGTQHVKVTLLMLLFVYRTSQAMAKWFKPETAG